MSDEERFDAIIVGAGVAGCACAYVLARAGKNVLLVERGASAGSKNVTGGRLYTYALEMLEPGLYEGAPLQRKVVREQIMFLSANSATTLDYADFDFGANPPQSFTVLRAPLDEWLAAESEAKGATVATGIRVDEPLERNGKIAGIRAGEDEMYADVVVAADGVNSFLAQKAGLFGEIAAQATGVGVKEIIEIPDNLIEARFNLRGNEGAARVALGCTEGIPGGAFLYTNKGSISLGIVLNAEQVGKQEKPIHSIMQDLKMHPAILPLIEGGTTVEYSAHLVPEMGLSRVPATLYREGMLVIGDAAGFVVNTGIIIRGMDLAIVSGLAAGNAIMKAGNPAEIGPLYMQQLEDLLLLPGMRVFQNWHEIQEIPRIYAEYPDLANEALKFLFTVDGKVPEKTMRALLRIIKKHVSLGRLMADGLKGLRSI